MQNYPLTLTFALMSATPKLTVTDAAGKTVLIASKTWLSQKDEIKIYLNGQPLYQVTSQESRITDIPSNWDVTNGNGQKIGMVDDDFLSIDTSAFVPNGAAAVGLNILKNQLLNEQALKMYWLKDPDGRQIGLIAPDKKSLSLQQLPLADITRKIPFFFRFITPHYFIRLGEQTVMTLQKERTLWQDTYKLEAKIQLTGDEEKLLLPSIVLTLFYERAQLKQLFGD